MKLRTSLLATLAATGALALTGCGDDHDTSSAKANATDAAFLNDMPRHHQGAIDMARLAQAHAQHPEIKALAGRIIASQQDEIDRMTSMREAMHDGAMHGGHMAMSDAEMGMDMDMDALGKARPFDKAFIDAMIPHHRGAITMARDLLAKGEDPELRAMAKDMIAAQTKEIAQMRMWRKQWYGAGHAMGMGG